MISPLIKWLPIEGIQLAYLFVLLSYLIFCPSPLLLTIFIVVIILLLKNYTIKKSVIVLLLLMGFATFLTVQKNRQNDFFDNQPNQIQKIRLIPDSTTINGDLLNFTGEYKSQKYSIFYKLKTKEEHDFFQKNVHFLDIISDIKLDIADESRNFNGFNYRKFLKNQGIYRIGRMSHISTIKKSRPNNVAEKLIILRRKGISWCLIKFPKPMSYYMAALLLGYLDKSFSEMTRVYSQLGIIHLFALSGMHVSFFIKNYQKLLIYLRIPRDYFPIAELIFSFFYAAMTGYSISVLRSLLQKNITHLGIKGLNNLSLTVMLIFFVKPYYLLTVGGVLSFIYAFLLSMIDNKASCQKAREVRKALALSFAVLPFLLMFCAQFNPLAIVLTFICGLLFDRLILPLLSLQFIFSPIWVLPFLNTVFLSLEKILIWLNSSLRMQIIVGSPNQIQLCLLCFLIALLYDYRNKWSLTKHLKVSFLILLVFLTVKYPIENEVTLIDVGQGDSIFIRDMANKTLLIDVGGVHHYQGKEEWQNRKKISNAEKTLIPYLKSKGVSKIDQLVLTHTDTDHVGDMEEVVREFKVKEILVSSGSLSNKTFHRRLVNLRVKVKLLMAGDYISIMGSKLAVLYPWKEGDGKNNDSLVLYGKLLNQKFLFTGDLEAEGEKEIINRYDNFKVDVLKVGHHGSKGSSTQEFISNISPKIGLISAGKNNFYKHPHQETLKRFESRHIKIYRTDQQGAVRFRGINKWIIETCH